MLLLLAGWGSPRDLRSAQAQAEDRGLEGRRGLQQIPRLQEHARMLQCSQLLFRTALTLESTALLSSTSSAQNNTRLPSTPYVAICSPIT